MIIAAHVTMALGDRIVLKDVSVEVRPGEVLVLLGPNGAGKSTLLNVLSGLLKPSEGDVWFEQAPMSACDPSMLARRRAVLAQKSMLNFGFSVRDVVAMGRAPHRSGPAHNRAVVQLSLDHAGISHLSERVYTTLSGGEQQRVHIARALAQVWSEDDAYLFLDEPIAALDLKHQHHLLNLLRDMAHDKGVGVCCVLHDLVLAAQYADRCAILQNGQLQELGPPVRVLTPDVIERVFEICPAWLGLERKGRHESHLELCL